MQPEAQVNFGARIPLRDGVRLSATLYLPRAHSEPSPVLFTLTPYVGQTYHERGLYFASHGYPFLTVDARGRGNSEGEFIPFDNEARDAFDIVAWVAQQPYCNGKVAMWGGSYGGYVQWAAAKERPRQLATIVPVAAPCLGVDFPGRSNIYAPYLMQWLTLVWGRTSQDRMFWGQERYWSEKFCQWFESGAPFKDLDTQLGSHSAIFQDWLAHPHQDEHWDRYGPSAAQYSKVSLPVLTITGIYDGDQPGALAYFRAHIEHNPAAQHYLIIGPWDHAGTRTPVAEFCGIRCGPESLLDLGRLHVEWYDWTMRGGPKPKFLQKPVAYYVMGAENWRYADTLEAITERSLPFYLDSTANPTDVFRSGTLGPLSPVRAQPDLYTYDPRDVSRAQLESTVDPQSRTDHRMIHASVGKRLVYHSEPFEEDVELSGFFKLCAWVSIDQPDTDFRAAVYEVDLDGSARELTSDSMRARYRESLHKPKLIDTQEPLLYRFERFTFISRQVKKGNRLRLVLGAIDSIYSQKNYNSGGEVSDESIEDARPVIVRLFHDERRLSALYVPFGQTQA